MLKELNYSIDKDENAILDIARALSSPHRIDILKLLNSKSMNIKELATALKQPVSSTANNVDILFQCGLITIEDQYNSFGKFRLCSRNCDGIFLMLHRGSYMAPNNYRLSLPIGSFYSYDITPVCGFTTKIGPVGMDNDVDTFLHHRRSEAALMWFASGYVEYRFSRKHITQAIKSFSLSFEACSEAPFYRDDWKSDITLIVNDKIAGTWTCPGDFGGRRGKYNPTWWSDDLTQYGILTEWTLDKNGVHMNGKKLSDTLISEFDLESKSYISFKLAVLPNAENVGGINIFGSSFGDYRQDIIVNLTW